MHRNSVNGPSSKPSRYHQRSVQAPPGDDILAFVSSLRDIEPDMVNSMTVVFKDYGVKTSADLDQLCQMEEYWGDVEQYFCSRGLTPLHWELIADGLRARYAAARW